MRGGEKGEGGEFGLGSDEDFSILEVAQMFGGPIEMKPEARGNRMSAQLDSTKSRALGWQATHHLQDYINSFL